MTSNTALPSACLDLSQFEPSDRWDVWREFHKGLMDVEPNIADPSTMRAKSDFYSCGQTIVGRNTHDATFFHRNPRGLPLQSEERLILSLNYKGVTKSVMSDRSMEFSPLRFTLFNFDQSISCNTASCDYIYISMPFSEIGYDPSKHQEFMQFDRASPAGRVLLSNLEMMLEGIPHSSTEDAMAMGDGFCGLLKGLISRDLRHETVQRQFTQSREVAARRFIEENLRDVSLDTDMICNVIGISRAVLYRMFEAEGGVKRAIFQKRLERSRVELAKTEPKRGAVVKVAKHWAFTDQAHFARLFRERFNVRPSDVLGSDLASPAPYITTPKKLKFQFNPLINLYEGNRDRLPTPANKQTNIQLKETYAQKTARCRPGFPAKSSA
ncbi:helix-turn-helix domain-containing protein [Tateyamaria sp. SN3-11]|uniref:helix-turn-helix domain-containing protein n=1 Tax=Tateyamaria sp. SN3-11 TaxID=3092147 RepID=UPI0039EA8CB0